MNSNFIIQNTPNSRVRKGNHRPLILALISLNFFILCTLLESKIGLNNVVKYLFSSYSLINIFRFAMTSKKRVGGKTFIETLIIIFTIYSLLLLLESINFSVNYVQHFFGASFEYLPFLVPIIFLRLNFNTNFFKSLILITRIFLPLAILTEIVVIFFALRMDAYPLNIISILTFTISPFLLLATGIDSQNKSYSHLALVYFFLIIIISASLGRRGETLEPVFMLIWIYLVKMKSTSIQKIGKIKLRILSVFLLLLFAFVYIYYSDSLLIFQRGFTQEGFDESRGETVDMFLADFGSRDMDYFIGRGLNGFVQKFNRGEQGLSNSIEIGYFHLMLKGGLLYLIPYFIILFTSFYLGFYRSKNDISRALSGLILWQLIYMVTFGIPNFNLSYSLIWIAVATNLNPSFRCLSNKEILMDKI